MLHIKAILNHLKPNSKSKNIYFFNTKKYISALTDVQFCSYLEQTTPHNNTTTPTCRIVFITTTTRQVTEQTDVLLLK
jgi:hypothetical protein